MKKKKRKASKNLGGRPRKITPQVVEEVAALMAKGVPEEYACALCGVLSETYGPAVSRSPELKAIARRHHAQFIADSLEIIKKGGEVIEVVDGQDEAGNPIIKEKLMPWTGRAWIMERRYKPHFTRTEVVKPAEGVGERGGLLLAVEEQAALEQMAKDMFVRVPGGKGVK